MLMRTHDCGELRSLHVGQKVKLCGWMHKYRNLGNLHFMVLRDKYGITQLGFEKYQGNIDEIRKISLESVICATGLVQMRPKDAYNHDMSTGEIEVQVENIEVLSMAEIPPFLPSSQVEATEDLRLKYRYLDLRNHKLQEILMLRSHAMLKVRKILNENKFCEVETPILYKSTPEGARDYVVPSRVHAGKVYALPQSPQTLKQLLMIGGVDRYFQICRCFRDEDLRADRQPEFSQIDMEMSFVTKEFVKEICEKIVRELFGFDSNFTFPVMTYENAMKLYGSDKPDLRYGLEHMIVTDLFKDSSFEVFSSTAKDDGLIKAIFLPASLGPLTRKDIDQLADVVKPYGGKGVAWFKVDESGRSGGISKFITDPIYEQLNKFRENEIGDVHGVWLFCADKKESIVHASADSLRRYLARKFDLCSSSGAPKYAFLWLTDFPLLEYDEESKRLTACHHPFTNPSCDDLKLFMEGQGGELSKVKAQAYDVICNGYELGGGSMRIFNQAVQARMFEVLGLTQEQISNQFGFFIEALKYGTPPHGGFAFGFDRIIMLLAGTDNIRDVIAFPKTASAADLMAQAPSRPSEEQIKELHFRWIE